MRGLALAGALIALVAATGTLLDDEATYESFEQGWGAWSPDAHVWCYDDPDPCDWQHSAERELGWAYERVWGIHVVQEGRHDSGAVWVERILATPPGERVEVAFWVLAASPDTGPMTPYQARAYVGTEDPEQEGDLALAGRIDQPGWHRYCLSAPAPETEEIWVAAGVRTAWESGERHHGLDHVSVRGTTAEEACDPTSQPCHLAGEPCSVERTLCAAVACPSGEPPLASAVAPPDQGH